MLNVTTVRDEVHTENLLVVGVDVSKDKLDLYAEHTDPPEECRQKLDGQVPNRSDEIKAILRKLAGYAEEKRLEGLLVVCEPTGGYEDQLFETARRLGHETAYVNGEHVANASVIDPDGRRDRAKPTGRTLA
jgi:transposase